MEASQMAVSTGRQDAHRPAATTAPPRPGSAGDAVVGKSVEDQHREVVEWLALLYGRAGGGGGGGGDGVPRWEINATTVQTLYSLMQRSQRQEHAAMHLQAAHTAAAAEYRAEADRLEGVLDEVGVDCKPTAASRALVQMAVALDLKDTALDSYLLSFNDLTNDLVRLRRELCDHSVPFHPHAARKQLVELEARLSALESGAAEKTKEMDKRARRVEFLDRKAQAYLNDNHSAADQLRRNGYTSAVKHASLVKDARRIERTKEELAPIMAALTSYQELPPDLALAEVKVAGLRQELQRLEAHLQSSLDLSES